MKVLHLTRMDVGCWDVTMWLQVDCVDQNPHQHVVDWLMRIFFFCLQFRLRLLQSSSCSGLSPVYTFLEMFLNYYAEFVCLFAVVLK